MNDLNVVQIPYNWQPRDYQLEGWNALESGIKRACFVWHRRAGKDSVGLNYMITATQKRVGTYWHMLPTLRQGRKIVWQGITKEGRKFLDFWPEELIKKKRDDEMMIELTNGSVWQVVGSDNYDALVGTNPIGVILSEYSLSVPSAWDFIRPILAENGGWAAFLYTPRGRNHGYDLYQMAKNNPKWFCQLLTADDTLAISNEAIQEELDAGMAQSLVDQEFYCSFDAPLVGSYYGDQMAKALLDKRIGNVPHDPAVPVETWWDLGIGDDTSIWFVQRVGLEVHVIDTYSASGKKLSHYVNILQQKAMTREYVYGDHIFPHDTKARELISGITREKALKSLGIKATILVRHDIDDGIDAVRSMMGSVWFDEENCKDGIEALRQYRKIWDEKRKMFADSPYHDWSSHYADAFRMGAMHKRRKKASPYRPRKLAIA
jgi:phage terminase large subunit